MRAKRLGVLAAFLSTLLSTHGTALATGEVTTIPTLCRNLESYITMMAREAPKLRGGIVNNPDKASRLKILEDADGYDQSRIEMEQSWARLGCAQILYGK